MTTPSDNTPTAIIEDAMLEAGLLQEGATPSSEQYARNMRRLRDIINFYQTQGVKLFLLSDQSVTLTEGDDTYTIMSGGDVNIDRPMQVIQAYWLSSTNIRRDLSLISWNEYLRLGQIGEEGSINSIFVNKQYNQFIIKTWPEPTSTDATGTLHLLIRKQAANPLNLTTTIEFPPEWRIFLHWELARQLSHGQPEGVRAWCAAQAETYRQALEGFDVEDVGVSFQVDMQGYPSGDFA